ncbi:MAG: peroxiredoxin [Gammaproteobacteria bacterium]|nr:peroxiredoxin [Gammaproteobacteria bacterium]MDD9824833.1 peroxiredoxin [Gammaproteobacteria bacterium]
MSIQVGEQIPSAQVTIMGEEGPRMVDTRELFGKGRIVLFAVPGAFTPTCTAAHLPGYVVNADKIKAKGVERIFCLAMNDAFVMDAWGKSQNAEAISMIADGNGDFARALALTLDASGFGMGTRSQRFALIAEDGMVRQLFLEEGTGLENSAAEKVLAAL